MRLRMSVAVAVACMFVAITTAQVPRGRITGVVTDNAGGVLPGVTVTLRGPERHTTVTNDRGEFAFENLVSGKYAIRATLVVSAARR